MSGDADAVFLAHRPMVVAIGYDITGSVADAEDVAQQAYLRWAGAAGDVRHPRAWLARCATNLAIDVLRGRDRVDYVGPWLPEPLPTNDFPAVGTDATESVELAEAVSVALQVALQALSPLERAALLLHDVFAFGHDEVAEMLGRTPAAVRQLVSRARAHARDPVRRQAIDRAAHRELADRFLAAAAGQDLAALTALLADDVRLVSDGGGVKAATRRPVVGRDAVLRFVFGLIEKSAGRLGVTPIELNLCPGLLVTLDGELDLAWWFVIEQGQITQILMQRNPAKLVHLQ